MNKYLLSILIMLLCLAGAAVLYKLIVWKESEIKIQPVENIRKSEKKAKSPDWSKLPQNWDTNIKG